MLLLVLFSSIISSVGCFSPESDRFKVHLSFFQHFLFALVSVASWITFRCLNHVILSFNSFSLSFNSLFFFLCSFSHSHLITSDFFPNMYRHFNGVFSSSSSSMCFICLWFLFFYLRSVRLSSFECRWLLMQRNNVQQPKPWSPDAKWQKRRRITTTTTI